MKILGKYPNLRLRRVRKSDWIRRLVSENKLSADDLILPIFVREGKSKIEPIKSMPGINRYSVDKLSYVVEKACNFKIPLIALFPYTPDNKKNNYGTEALNRNNLVCRALKNKKNFKEIGTMCDVALDPYTSHGHDGIFLNGDVDNDKTIKILAKQALLQAQMGCDIIAPSDMMDGRVAEIRKILDKNNFKNTKILSYAVKYASNFYGPFRDAVGSKRRLKGTKKLIKWILEILKKPREVAVDINEGADMIMVKPGMPYLDIIKTIKDSFKIPVISYQMSGEFSLIKNGIKNKLINEDSILESLTSKRADPLR